jgi:Tfp pilus assembly protein PilN
MSSVCCGVLRTKFAEQEKRNKELEQQMKKQSAEMKKLAAAPTTALTVPRRRPVQAAVQDARAAHLARRWSRAASCSCRGWATS